MSEYQYYEFQAVDRPLDEEDRRALRAISTRARISSTSFTNSYEYGSLKGDPTKFMERWFDLHLYLANWGSRCLMIRFPKRLINLDRLDHFLGEVDWVTVHTAGDNVILDISGDEREAEAEAEDDWDGGDDDGDGSGWLAVLAPLRADVLSGDLRLFYLLWLTAVEDGAYEDDAPEPMSGIGPMTGSLEAFAKFFGIDADLVAAAAERSQEWRAMPPSAVRYVLEAMTDAGKVDMLTRLFDGDPHVGAELRAMVRSGLTQGIDASPPRTVGDLKSRAKAIRGERERAAAEKAAADKRRKAEEAEKARRSRLDSVARRGESVWRQIETDIEARNAQGYDRAASLLIDLAALAREHGATETFTRRLHGIRERHARKGQFIKRLETIV